MLCVLQVQTLLQQMQDKFQTMSDQIIGRNILPFGIKKLLKQFTYKLYRLFL